MKTTIENFRETINFKKPDRILSYDLLMNEELFYMYGGESGSIIERNAKMLKAVGLDCTRSIFDPSTHWLNTKIECWEKFLGVKKDGFEVKASGGTSWIARRPFTDIEGLKRNLPKMPKIDEVAEWYVPFLKEVKQVFDKNDLVFIGAVEGPLTDAYDYVDMELFSYLIYDEPDLVDYMLDVTTQWSSIMVELYCQYPTSDAFLIGEDIAYKSATIFSIDFLKEKLYPRWKKIVKPLKDSGIKFLYHSDGNLNMILDDLVNVVGIEGLNPIEPTANMDIAKIREKYPELILLGNVDTAGELLSSEPKDVEGAVKSLINKIGSCGGLLAGSSTEISDAVCLPNILALYDSIKKYGPLV